MKTLLCAFLLATLGGCASMTLPGQNPDPTGTQIALTVIQAASSLATQNCISIVPPDPAVACTLPTNSTAAQQQAVVQQCFAASLIGAVIARHQQLLCPPPTPAPVPSPTPAKPSAAPAPTKPTP